MASIGAQMAGAECVRRQMRMGTEEEDERWITEQRPRRRKFAAEAAFYPSKDEEGGRSEKVFILLLMRACKS